MKVASILKFILKKLGHFYTKRFKDFLPDFIQISKQTFTRIIHETVTGAVLII